MNGHGVQFDPNLVDLFPLTAPVFNEIISAPMRADHSAANRARAPRKAGPVEAQCWNAGAQASGGGQQLPRRALWVESCEMP